MKLHWTTTYAISKGQVFLGTQRRSLSLELIASVAVPSLDWRPREGWQTFCSWFHIHSPQERRQPQYLSQREISEAMLLLTLLWTLLLAVFSHFVSIHLIFLHLYCLCVLSSPPCPLEAQAFPTLEPPVLDGTLGQVVPPWGLTCPCPFPSQSDSSSLSEVHWEQKAEAGACPSVHLLIHCSFREAVNGCNTLSRWILWRLQDTKASLSSGAHCTEVCRLCLGLFLWRLYVNLLLLSKMLMSLGSFFVDGENVCFLDYIWLNFSCNS